jgi:isoleucyl-tRNA synthetase
MDKINYKNTLNLPKTSFPMKANLVGLEPKILAHWKKLDIYNKLQQERKDKDKFILHDGPPYANGLIHIGHALNKILKDIVVKHKLLKGFNVPFVIGWDCHGLPVEHQLFKELKLTKHDVDVADFRKKARKFALKYVELQKKDFKKLGVFCDWDNPYLTLNRYYEYGVIKLLESLAQDGYIYRGRKPVNWCGVCETALAEAEVEYLDKESDSIFCLFPVKSSASLEEHTYFLVWTTTPWTLVSNVAVAVHPQFEYCLAEFKDKRMVVCKDLIPLLTEKFDGQFKILKSFKGRELEGSILRHPFLDRESKVLNADFVSREEGSGCVHIAPGHGQEDFSLTKKYKLDIIMPVNDKGIFDAPAEFKGKNVSSANEYIINLLNKNGLLVKHQKITHSYPHCWRCKNAIIFRATYQWFLNVDHSKLRDKVLTEIENITWIPSNGKERMRAMVIQRPDWCLSRQRLWGIPIPAIKCKSCSQVTLDNEVIGRVAEVFKEKGADSWFTSDVVEFLPRGYKCSQCASTEFVKEFDILDVWFESGASFFSVVKSLPQLRFPADMYLEGSDQHRGWFQVSLIPSVAKEGASPFKTILTHGFVVDGEGRKMSKSLGNVIAPQEISKEYGSEILRLWSAYSDYSEDVKISKDIIKQLVDMYRKVRNTIRFILGNIHDFNLEKNVLPYKDLLEVDKFMLAKATAAFKEVVEFYENASFYKASRTIFNFCNLDLSSFYLDFLKDRLYTFAADSLPRRSAQFVLYHILGMLLKMIAPILSFTAEEVYLAWENLENKKESIFCTTVDENLKPEWIDSALMEKWNKIIELRGQVLKEIEKEREKGNVGSSLDAAVLLKFKGDEFKFYANCVDSLREIFIVSKVCVEEGDSQIRVSKSGDEKCLRCWNLRDDVGGNDKFPSVCGRCSEVLENIAC